ncbi:hypothetical protein C0Q70_01427 [Pomacea canaliculata]|uniref:Uncharacterized protein n=1 Tax=Pomacea canaliculata TaxID=400727 RepID=A0A2T7PZF6_POMCA|nr:hypothetical protein C0Q70_01427 [Pomacea canaliculata]
MPGRREEAKCLETGLSSFCMHTSFEPFWEGTSKQHSDFRVNAWSACHLKSQSTYSKLLRIRRKPLRAADVSHFASRGGAAAMAKGRRQSPKTVSPVPATGGHDSPPFHMSLEVCSSLTSSSTDAACFVQGSLGAVTKRATALRNLGRK